MKGKEVSWFGKINKIKDTLFELDEIYFPPQICSPAYVETDPEHYAKWWFETIIKEKLHQDIRLHGHTHPGFSTNPSGTDTAQFQQISKEVDDYYIQLILNDQLNFYCRYHDIANKKQYEMIVSFDTQDKVKEELKAVVKEKVYVPKVYTPLTGNTIAGGHHDKWDHWDSVTRNKTVNVTTTYRSQYQNMVSKIESKILGTISIHNNEERMDLIDNINIFLHSEFHSKTIIKTLDEVQNKLTLEERVATDLMLWGIGYDVISIIKKDKPVIMTQTDIFDFMEPSSEFETYNPFPDVEEYNPKNYIDGGSTDVEFE